MINEYFWEQVKAAKLGVSVEFLVTGRLNDTKRVVENIRTLLHRAEENLGKLPDSK